MSPRQARNAIKKALVEIIDPKPKKKAIDAMWKHFESRCAFCEKKLKREKREGHADHLILLPPAEGTPFTTGSSPALRAMATRS